MSNDACISRNVPERSWTFNDTTSQKSAQSHLATTGTPIASASSIAFESPSLMEVFRTASARLKALCNSCMGIAWCKKKQADPCNCCTSKETWTFLDGRDMHPPLLQPYWSTLLPGLVPPQAQRCGDWLLPSMPIWRSRRTGTRHPSLAEDQQVICTTDLPAHGVGTGTTRSNNEQKRKEKTLLHVFVKERISMSQTVMCKSHARTAGGITQ